MNRKKIAQEMIDQYITPYGIRHPDTYTADEIAEHCPEIPREVIDAHVEKRDKK